MGTRKIETDPIVKLAPNIFNCSWLLNTISKKDMESKNRLTEDQIRPRKLKIINRKKNKEDINFLIAPLTPKLKYEVLVYIEKKENDR